MFFKVFGNFHPALMCKSFVHSSRYHGGGGGMSIIEQRINSSWFNLVVLNLNFTLESHLEKCLRPPTIP